MVRLNQSSKPWRRAPCRRSFVEGIRYPPWIFESSLSSSPIYVRSFRAVRGRTILFEIPFVVENIVLNGSWRRHSPPDVSCFRRRPFLAVEPVDPSFDQSIRKSIQMSPQKIPFWTLIVVSSPHDGCCSREFMNRVHPIRHKWRHEFDFLTFWRPPRRQGCQDGCQVCFGGAERLPGLQHLHFLDIFELKCIILEFWLHLWTYPFWFSSFS